MNEEYKTASAVFEKYGLGEITVPVEAVTGGLMHKMYKVQTSSGTYALKCLNPEIMKRPGALANFAAAEDLERVLEEHGLPIVPALSFDGKKMLLLDGRYFYIYNWQEGRITDPRAITKEQCFTAGEILGKIHGIDSHNVEPEEPEIAAVDFSSYLQKAEEKNSPIAPYLKENLELLEKAQEALNFAITGLPPMRAINNGDMDPKNIMWHNGKPHVIDLECLNRGNPIATCLDLALQWSGTTELDFKSENLKAFFDGYLNAYDNGFRSYEDLYGIAYSWVAWLEYNILRALGIASAREEEIRLGEAEVRNTIGRIKYLHEMEGEVKKVLEDLPAPDPKCFSTHDDRLCYIDLVFEGGLSDIPEYPLPQGYRFVNYRPGDKDAWIDIELSSGEVLSKEHGEECWARYYGSREEELPTRMFFIENDEGEKIGTATAFYDIHREPDPDEGQLHWVAIKKDAQGKGLSKPLITFVLNVMKDLGYKRTKIHTQTNTWLACKVYSDLGFQPEKESLLKHHAGWKMVGLLTGKQFFEQSAVK